MCSSVKEDSNYKTKQCPNCKNHIKIGNLFETTQTYCQYCKHWNKWSDWILIYPKVYTDMDQQEQEQLNDYGKITKCCPKCSTIVRLAWSPNYDVDCPNPHCNVACNWKDWTDITGTNEEKKFLGLLDKDTITDGEITLNKKEQAVLTSLCNAVASISQYGFPVPLKEFDHWADYHWPKQECYDKPKVANEYNQCRIKLTNLGLVKPIKF